MISNKLLSLLISPDDQSDLIFDTRSNSLISKDHKITYNIVENIPILLPNNAKEVFETPQSHSSLDSKFYYIDHYEKDAALFDYFKEYEDAATIHENRRLHEAILNEIPKNTQNILDIGSGNAWIANAFQNENIDVVSFDVSTVNTKKALEKYPSKNHYAVTGDVYSLPFKNESFDCIVSAEVIEHVPDPISFIACLYRVLKKGGKLIISTPYNEKIPHYLCVHCNRPTPQHAHIHSFTKEKILSYVPEDAAKSNAYAFSNKFLAKLKTHIFLKYLPFSVWGIIDKLTNKIVKKQMRLILTITK